MEIADKDLNTERLIELSRGLPIIEVITDDDIAGFSEDDSGYWEKNITSKLCKGHFWRHLAHQNYRIGKF